MFTREIESQNPISVGNLPTAQCPPPAAGPGGLAMSTELLKPIETAILQLLAAVQTAQGQAVNPVGQAAKLMTVADLCNEFLMAKAQAGRSHNYLKLLRAEIASFAAGREARPVLSVTAGEIEAWLYSQPWADRTKRGRLLSVRNLYTWAIARGHVVANPAAAVDLPTDDAANQPPVIHSPDQVAQVLETARKQSAALCRSLAIRYFAGLRTSEVLQLDESEIKKGFIEVTAAKAKTRRRRLVTIQPALNAWLALGGELPLTQAHNRHRALVAALAGVPWAASVTRHSFVSYHLAQFQNAGLTALESGHSEQVMFNHYRELVDKKAARAFWGIRPRR